MCFNIALEHIATICKSIKGCSKAGSGAYGFEIEDVLRLMLKRNIAAGGKSEGLNASHVIMKATVHHRA